MRKHLAIFVVILAVAQKPLPVYGYDQHQQTQQKSGEASPDAQAAVAADVGKENAASAQRFAYYKANSKEYFKSAFAPANLSNWILAGLGIVGGLLGWWTVLGVKRQSKHIVTSERAWMVAEMTPSGENPMICPANGLLPISITCILKNKGKTPGFIIEIGNAIQVIEKGKSLPDMPSGYEAKNIAKWPGKGVPISPKARIAKFVSKDIQDPIDIVRGTTVLWVHGYVKYHDAFEDKIRETRYCFCWHPPKPDIGLRSAFFIDGPTAYNQGS